MSAADRIEAATLADALRAAGFEHVPERIEPGRTARFPGLGARASDRAGWCVAFADGAGAAWGDWRSGASGTWFADDPRTLPPTERDRLRRAAAEAREAAERERETEHRRAAEQARAILDGAPLATAHAYLSRKGIGPHGARIASDGRLLVPVYAPGGGLQSVQYVAEDGAKRFLPGGRLSGGWCRLGPDPHANPALPLLLAEGFATGATLTEATGLPVWLAFTAGNLDAVAKMLRAQFPDRRLLICGDEDRATVGNPGRTKATAAAAAVGAAVAFPLFPPDCEGSDFNDLAGRCGQAAVAGLIRAALDQHDRAQARGSGFRLVHLGGALAQPAPLPWLVRGVLTEGGLSMLFGLPASLKSFVLLDLALHIAAGRDWHGRSVQQGAVAIIAGEGFSGLHARVQAWRILHQPAGDLPLFASASGGNLATAEGLRDVLAALDEIAALGPLRLVGIDTLHRASPGIDENSAQDAGKIIGACDAIRARYGCAVAIVHHVGHAAPDRARGSSALHGALDTAVRIDRTDRSVSLTCTKQKDGPEHAPLYFEARTVETGWMDDEGEPVTSLTLHARADAPAEAVHNPPSGKNQRAALKALRELIIEQRANLAAGGYDPAGARVTVEDWRAACAMDRSRFSEARAGLESRRLVRIEAPHVYLTESEPACETTESLGGSHNSHARQRAKSAESDRFARIPDDEGELT